MKINVQFGDNSSKIIFNKYDYAFIGDDVDARGKAGIDFIKNNVKNVIHLNYVPSEFQMAIDGSQIPIDDFSDNIPNLVGKKVIVDATTVGFVELLLLLDILSEVNNNEYSILYVEPFSYNKKEHDHLLNFRDFDLSVQTTGYEGIPGYTLAIDSDYIQKIIFLCGFEAERMDRVIDNSNIITKNCKCIFGFPAFRPGWEMDSFANNILIMKGKNMRRDIDFCGATNPISVHRKLNEVFKTLDDDEQMFIVPLATKPMSIGACLFLAGKPKEKVAVLYDHPLKKAGRGIGVGKWHLYSIA